MPREPRIQFPGASYHVTSRGNNKQKIFLSNDDRCDFIDVLSRIGGDFRWTVHAYCLMDNHYHLLVETPDANLSPGMQQLNGNYCRNFNRVHGRIGHVTQGRFFSRLIEHDKHLLTLYRYISLNPVKEGLASVPEGYQWSSYSATSGFIPAPSFLETSYTLSLFSDETGRAREAFREYVMGGLEELRLDRSRRFSLDSLFQNATTGQARCEAIRKARRQVGFSVQELASYLRVHPTTIRRALKE